MDTRKIKEQVYEVIKHSQGIADPQVDELINNWTEAKKTFLDAFGGPIYEYPDKVRIHLSPYYKQKKILELEEYIATIYGNDKLVDFIELNRDSFFDNKVEKEGNYGYRGLKKGMKLVKAFKFFEEDKEALDKIQSLASQTIQEDKIEGTLCFSVHPLDYLSMSCNTYNWRSCHALDGEFRSGNLSYMLDNTTVVVYIKGINNTVIPMFPEDVKWNSKKWRVLWYVAKDCEYIFAGKQYPFESWEIMETARDIFIEIFKWDNSHWCHWTDPIIQSVKDSHRGEWNLKDRFISIRGELKPIRQVINDAKGSLQFNDVLNSSCYDPHYTIPFNYSYYPGIANTITVGAPVKCLWCGENYITNSESMMCDCCDREYGTEINGRFVYCSCCDSRIGREEAVWNDDEAFCETCYREYYFVCDECGELHHTSVMKYDKNTQEYICCQCYINRYPEEGLEELV